MFSPLNQLLEHGTDYTTNHCSQIKKRLNDVNNCTYIEVCLETGESVNQMFQLGTSILINNMIHFIPLTIVCFS